MLVAGCSLHLTESGNSRLYVAIKRMDVSGSRGDSDVLYSTIVHYALMCGRASFY